MCFVKSPKAPKVTPPPTAPPPPSAEVIDQEATTERNRERQRQRALAGRQSTILASRAQQYLPPTGQARVALGS